MKEFFVTLSLIYLFLFSLYHVITGTLAVFFSKTSLKFYKTIYGVVPIETEQLLLTFKPWGTLALIVGLIGFFTFFDIDNYFPLLYVFSLLLAIRIGYRSLMRKKASQIFQINTFQNLRMIIIQSIGVILFLFYVLEKSFS